MNQISNKQSNDNNDNKLENNINDIILFILFGIFVILILEILYKSCIKIVSHKLTSKYISNTINNSNITS